MKKTFNYTQIVFFIIYMVANDYPLTYENRVDDSFNGTNGP